LSYPDLAQVLQARIRADQQAEKVTHPRCSCAYPARRRTLGNLKATLEEALAKAEILAEQRRLEAETANNRIAIVEAQIIKLEEAVAKAETSGAQWRQDAQASTKRANDLVAELVEMTGELIEMSKRIAQQTVATDKLRAELDDHRSRSWWWQHAIG
jgi:predicted  nucleic acid-binding Zn-ribbon protein